MSLDAIYHAFAHGELRFTDAMMLADGRRAGRCKATVRAGQYAADVIVRTDGEDDGYRVAVVRVHDDADVIDGVRLQSCRDLIEEALTPRLDRVARDLEDRLFDGLLVDYWLNITLAPIPSAASSTQLTLW